MPDPDLSLDRVLQIARQPGGVGKLAREAGAPYTSVHSFVRREHHRNLEFLIRLIAAADRIADREGD